MMNSRLASRNSRLTWTSAGTCCASAVPAGTQASTRTKPKYAMSQSSSTSSSKEYKYQSRLFPGHRPGVKSLVVPLFDAERLTILEEDLYATGHLGGRAPAHGLVGPDIDFAEQVLHIFT